MSKRKIRSPEVLWAVFVQQALEVFSLALEMLQGTLGPLRKENDINKMLALKTNEAHHRLDQGRRGVGHRPVWEAQNQVLSEEDATSGHTSKKPDFQCELYDPQEENWRRASRIFCVECKRLGKAECGYILNKNYVEKGILRFLSAEHSYGKGANGGAMVGYIQGMDLNEVLREVNTHIAATKSYPVPPILFPFGFPSEVVVAKGTQQLTRTEVTPSPFELNHLWVVLHRDKPHT